MPSIPPLIRDMPLPAVVVCVGYCPTWRGLLADRSHTEFSLYAYINIHFIFKSLINSLMKKIKFLAMMMFAIVACAGFTACGDDDEDGANALVGTWVGCFADYPDEEVVTMTFTKDGKMTATGVDAYHPNDNWSFSGAYTTQKSGTDNVVLISFGGYFAGEEDEYYDNDLEFRPCYINGNTLTIFFDGSDCVLVKQ